MALKLIYKEIKVITKRRISTLHIGGERTQKGNRQPMKLWLSGIDLVQRNRYIASLDVNACDDIISRF